MLHSMPAVGGRGEETGLNPVQLPLLCLQESVVEAGSSHSGQPGEGMAAGAGIGIPQCISQKTGDVVILQTGKVMGRNLVIVSREKRGVADLVCHALSIFPWRVRHGLTGFKTPLSAQGLHQQTSLLLPEALKRSFPFGRKRPGRAVGGPAGCAPPL